MSLKPALLEILACPEDHGPLLYFEEDQILYNPRLRRSYRIVDDIPVMLIEEATGVTAEDHDRLMARAEAEGVRPNFEPEGPQ